MPHGQWLFLLLSIVSSTVMGSVLDGAAALIFFGPLVTPVGKQLGVDRLHYGLPHFGMGFGLFALPVLSGFYSACR